MSAGKYPNRIRLSMTRELMEICFAKYVPHDHLQKELFLHVTRNRGRNSRMHRMIADANPKPESLKPSDARGLSEDAYTTKPESVFYASIGTFYVQEHLLLHVVPRLRKLLYRVISMRMEVPPIHIGKP
ncbi:unnamed protein product [Fasciola hepatica]|uniref:Uncharacterized protein n=1 Tax=Fasciola hepatica TaxID=6192 RepID=A0ABC9HIA1_FASHE